MPVVTDLDIVRGHRGHISGYAVSQYVIDAPRGDGKIPLLTEYVTGRDGADIVLRNFRGCEYRDSDVM